jgi:hypothetical protein
MSTKAGDVARLLFRAQLLIETAIHDIPGDRYAAADYEELATVFGQLAGLMRECARSVVVDVPPSDVVRSDDA